ncbi:MAG: VOC family protein [Gemmatimonadetes bacterium]|nr:VOC family protein [Gemmatimonadota bacterium]NIR77143.1 VOC family protein [Gemmatimonadota bacterium]NIT85658.1 VOC family protein [Gemmatimonadota bacterium]NIU29490.1 VOC family protein [Gemmatimonadota bacterium]NIU34544.1 VOC family protein [Gemmatimonadota bacterium]
MTGRIRQIALTVEDVERATAFYRDRLGMPHLFSAGRMAFFDCDGVRLMLALPEDEVPAASSILYFATEGIADAHRSLVERGVAFRDEPHVVHRDDKHELWMTFFEDGEGNLHALIEEVPVA